jgi:hypothetical protein
MAAVVAAAAAVLVVLAELAIKIVLVLEYVGLI